VLLQAGLQTLRDFSEKYKNFFTENKLQKIDFIRFVMYITNSLIAKRDFKALQ
jgi:hypothetical protein